MGGDWSDFVFGCLMLLLGWGCGYGLGLIGLLIWWVVVVSVVWMLVLFVLG